ncbi:MAG TPA: Lrp/AsnC family transcriptional regulator [Candidatus Dormibacteraeota bacterium]|jgi:DNA-binding Lrp family transcriptional regulator|nr:Lrp/AsnC family transcriptional regulator [Candidatus Dormibacteraeota bacterium]
MGRHDDDDLEEEAGRASAPSRGTNGASARGHGAGSDATAAAGRRRRAGAATAATADGDEAVRPPVAVDRIDRHILELLRDDGRLPVAALAERAGISRANAYTRLERLRGEGVIRGFSANVDVGRLGLGIAALVLIAGRQPAWRELRDELLHMPEVEYCVFTTGEYDALILVRVPDVETLRDVILERLQSTPAVRATQTVFVLDEVVRRPYVLP